MNEDLKISYKIHKRTVDSNKKLSALVKEWRTKYQKLLSCHRLLTKPERKLKCQK